jgi:hypothetical protein
MADNNQTAQPIEISIEDELATATFDSPELSRLAAEVARRQNDAEGIAYQQADTGFFKRNLPYAALAIATLMALFSVYEAHLVPQPVSIAPIAPSVSTPDENAPIAVAPVPALPTPTAPQAAAPKIAPQTAEKLQQISDCQMSSLRAYPNVADLHGLQMFNECMLNAGYKTDYTCDTTGGVPAYNPACWAANIAP